MSQDEKRELNIDLAIAGSKAKTDFLLCLATLMERHKHELPQGFVNEVEAEINTLATKMDQLTREIA